MVPFFFNFTLPVIKLRSTHVNSKPANKLTKLFFKKQNNGHTFNKVFDHNT